MKMQTQNLMKQSKHIRTILSLKIVLIVCCFVLLNIAAAQEANMPLTPDNAANLNPLSYTEMRNPVQEFFFDAENRIGVHAADATLTWLDAELSSSEAETYPYVVHPAGGVVQGIENAVTLDGTELYTHDDRVTDSRFSADGAWIASTGLDNTVRVFRFEDAAFYVLTGYDAPSENLLFSPDNRVLVSTNAALNQVRFLVLETGQQVTLPGSAPLAFSPDGATIAYTRDQKPVVVSRIQGVIAERVESVVSRLEGHAAPILHLAFRPDGAMVGTGSRDGTISLWNPRTGEEIAVLMGHAAAVTRLAFHPENGLLASGDENGTLILWDSDSGAMLYEMRGHTAPISAIAFHADGSHLLSGDETGQVILWGVGEATTLPEPDEIPTAEPMTVSLEMIDAGVVGTVRADLSAGYHPDYPVGCTIAENERILAVARSAQGAYLVYSESDTCEGAVWVFADGRFFNWTDFNGVMELPTLTPPPDSPRVRMADVEAFCAAASGVASVPDAPVSIYPPDFVPESAQATLASGTDVIICHEYSTIAIGNCHYRPQLYSYVYTRLRTDDLISLVDAQTGGVIDTRRFTGQTPPPCPETPTRGEVAGEPAAPFTWMPWVLETLRYENAEPTRTVARFEEIAVYGETLRASNEVARLSDNTPVNLIARSSDSDWGLVLLPDMSRGWIELSDLWIAPETEVAALAVTDNPIATAPRDSDALRGLSAVRPLGRFFVRADFTVSSPNGYFLATVEPVEDSYNADVGSFEENTLSMWDIRGGNLLWSISLAQPAWSNVVFSPDSQTLFISTEQEYDPRHDISLTFIDVASGQVISELPDLDIYQQPLIAGNMTQNVGIAPRYAGDAVIVNYWRRGAGELCAVWDIPSGVMLWESQALCGGVNPARRYLIIEQPFTDFTSSYHQLLVHDVRSGAVIAASADEAADYRWLDDERVMIQRPYGEPPVIWNVLDNSRAIVELPHPLGAFFPTSLQNFMFYRADSVTYTWDMATGELLSETTLPGQFVEQNGRIVAINYTPLYELPQEEDAEPFFLTADDVASEEELWRLRWTHTDLTYREDGLFAYAFNLATGIVDVFDLVNGEIVGTIPLPYYDFWMTPDWNWIVQGSWNLYTVWGAESWSDAASNPPHARTRTETPAYYEANTRFEYPGFLSADTYLWLVYRSEDDAWVQVEDAFQSRYWVETSALDLLAPLSEIPVYE